MQAQKSLSHKGASSRSELSVVPTAASSAYTNNGSARSERPRSMRSTGVRSTAALRTSDGLADRWLCFLDAADERDSLSFSAAETERDRLRIGCAAALALCLAILSRFVSFAVVSLLSTEGEDQLRLLLFVLLVFVAASSLLALCSCALLYAMERISAQTASHSFLCISAASLCALAVLCACVSADEDERGSLFERHSLEVTAYLLLSPCALFHLLPALRWRTALRAEAAAMCVSFALIMSSAARVSLVLWAVLSAALLSSMFCAQRDRLRLFTQHRQLVEALQREKASASALRSLSADTQSLVHIVSGIAHNLMTPALSIASSCDVLTNKRFPLNTENLPDSAPCVSAGDKESREAMDELRRASAELQRSLSRFSDYTKVAHGLPLSSRVESLSISNTLRSALRSVGAQQDRVSLWISDEVCDVVRTDRQWLQLNLLCLVANALQFSPEGSADVHVSLSLRESARKRDTKPRLSLRAASLHSVSGRSARAGNKSQTDSQRESVGPNMSLPLSRSSSFSSVSHTRIKHTGSRSRREIRPWDGESERESMCERESIAGEEMLLVEVEDEGPGVSRELLRTLFDAQKQAQRIAKGHGIGLFALAKRVEALRGECGVSHRRDGRRGALFWFSVPYIPDELGALAIRDSAAQSARMSEHGLSIRAAQDSFFLAAHTFSESQDALEEQSLPPDCIAQEENEFVSRKLRILLVDESPALRKSAMALLGTEGHLVTFAENGFEALKMLENDDEGFDLLLVDLQMSMMDGLETIQRIRFRERKAFGRNASINMGGNIKRDARTELPMIEGTNAKGKQSPLLIFACSMNNDPLSVAEALQNGADDFLIKPLHLQTFRELLVLHGLVRA